MLKKTSAYTGLVIATAAGALLASSPANAQVTVVEGSYHHHHRSHNRNWNGHQHRGRIFIRIYIYNKNTNHAKALAAAPHRHRRVGLVTTAVPTGALGGLATPNQVPAATDQVPTATNQVPAATTPDTTTPAASSVNPAPVTNPGTVGAGTGIGANASDLAPRDATPTA